MASREDQLKELLTKDVELTKKVLDCPSPQKLVSLLEGKGIKLTELEASKILRAVNFYNASSHLTEGNHPEKIVGEGTSTKRVSDDELDGLGGGIIGAIVGLFTIGKSALEFKRQWDMYKEERDSHLKQQVPPPVPGPDANISGKEKAKKLEAWLRGLGESPS